MSEPETDAQRNDVTLRLPPVTTSDANVELIQIEVPGSKSGQGLRGGKHKVPATGAFPECCYAFWSSVRPGHTRSDAESFLTRMRDEVINGKPEFSYALADQEGGRILSREEMRHGGRRGRESTHGG